MTTPTDASERPLVQRLMAALGTEYTLEGEIGRGGMGVVYRARDERLHRRVAIKVLPPELAFQKEIRERFTREAQTAARLSHPHIVPIHDVGEGAGVVYFIMGLVEGESLGARLKRRGSLPPDEVRRIMKETADALSAAHAVSVIHRDIKPDNILLEGTRGRVMVTDFGIAKAVSQTSVATLTGIGVAIGTPQYMSPEQAAGEREIDGRSDLYSLGVVAYQMTSGELPFNAPTVAGILMKQITEPAPVLHESRSEVPEDLSLAIARCLEKDPTNRWPTADALRRALESRTVTGYRPSATGAGAASRRSPPGTRPRPSSTLGRSIPRSPQVPGMPVPRAPRPLPPGPRLGAPGVGGAGRGGYVRNERGEWIRVADSGALPLPDTGEPPIVQRVRAQFARWAAVTGGCFLLNLATGITNGPWFLFVAAGFGFPLLKSYSQLWQVGYSWRDVLHPPPAADAVLVPGAKGGARRPQKPPTQAEYGAYFGRVSQVHTDRQFILSLMEKLPASDREMLPEIVETADDLYQRSLELGKTLNDIDVNFGQDTPERIRQRVELLRAQPEGPERERQIEIYEKQLRTATELTDRRNKIAARLESSVLAMQNMRFDLLRLRTAGIGAVLGDLTQATQQARAISRDVDHAIAAASEVREAMG
ncbi:MAG TPA: serine/threonine-protein kinase [Gemmatimonadales bacterium]|jgi:serine/threonine-protein kinase|nr:serine/threonine-protein kinase [Gemmatimonadales bacterium]